MAWTDATVCGSAPSEARLLRFRVSQELDAQEQRLQLGQRRALHLRGYLNTAALLGFRCRHLVPPCSCCQSARGVRHYSRQHEALNASVHSRLSSQQRPYDHTMSHQSVFTTFADDAVPLRGTKGCCYLN